MTRALALILTLLWPPALAREPCPVFPDEEEALDDLRRRARAIGVDPTPLETGSTPGAEGPGRAAEARRPVD
jgi:hypothetical protein